MEIRTLPHKKFTTKDEHGEVNGFLVPIYNIHDGFFAEGKEPQQVYMTTILPGTVKGPHLHFIRTGFFTCIKGMNNSGRVACPRCLISVVRK